MLGRTPFNLDRAAAERGLLDRMYPALDLGLLNAAGMSSPAIQMRHTDYTYSSGDVGLKVSEH